MTVEELLELPTFDFTAYVRENVGNDDPAVWRVLLDERLIDATRDTLTAINLDIESQFGQQKARLDDFPKDRVGQFQSIACGTGGCLVRVPFDQSNLLSGIRDLFRHWTSKHPEYASQEPLFLYKNLRSTLTEAQREYLEADAEYTDWKRRAKGYRRIVLRRLDEAKLVAMAVNSRSAAHRTTPRGSTPKPNQTKIQHNIRSLFELAYAIYLHREACLAAGVVPETHDIDLWEKLDVCSSYGTEHGSQPLIDWLEHVMSKPEWVPPGERH